MSFSFFPCSSGAQVDGCFDVKAEGYRSLQPIFIMMRILSSECYHLI